MPLHTRTKHSSGPYCIIRSANNNASSYFPLRFRKLLQAGEKICMVREIHNTPFQFLHPSCSKIHSKPSATYKDTPAHTVRFLEYQQSHTADITYHALVSPELASCGYNPIGHTGIHRIRLIQEIKSLFNAGYSAEDKYKSKNRNASV